jgi:hypothetical protein
MIPTTFTSGDLCKRFGIMPWQLLQAIRRKFLAEPHRIGNYRAWTEDDLPRVEQALREAGYIGAEETASA